MPSSPGRIEDIAEIMKKEQSQSESTRNVDSMYETDVSNATHNNSAVIDIGARSKRQSVHAAIQQLQPKRAKKSLESSWETSELPFAIETPVSFGWHVWSFVHTMLTHLIVATRRANL